MTEPATKRSARTGGRFVTPKERYATTESWPDKARCRGVLDFTEWPKSSRLILCGACVVAEPCHEWQSHQRCEKGHKRRRDECSGCQDFTTIKEAT